MEKREKNQKAELTTQQIVMLVILITGFVVVLFFLFKLNLGAESEKEICHNSVVMKGSTVLPDEAVELNCQRSYVCITEDGSCDGLVNPEKIKVKSLEEVYDALGEKLADCWWMFGEGKIDYIGKKALKNNYCSICNQILFDDSLKNIEGVEEEISKDELYNYLAEKEISEEETYADYLFGTSDIGSLKSEIVNSEGNEEKIGTFGSLGIGAEKQSYIMMGITSEVSGFVWVGIGTATAVGTFFIVSNPVGWVAGAIIAGAVGTGAGIGGSEIAEKINPEIAAVTVEGKGIKNNFMAPTIQEIDSEKFEALNCEEIVTYA